MRITLAYNLRRSDAPEEAELLTGEDVDRLERTLRQLGHDVTPVEMSTHLPEVVDILVGSRPDLVFNVAEGRGSARGREAQYPAIYEQLGLPHTGGGTSLLYVGLDKRLSERILSVRGIRVPHGGVVSPASPELPEGLEPPLMIKPNFEGSSRGIGKDALVHDLEEARATIDRRLKEFPDGMAVEQFIEGRELAVPHLEAWPGGVLEIVETVVAPEAHRGDETFLDFDLKQKGDVIHAVSPPEDLKPEERQEILALAERSFDMMPCPDLGRVDIRLRPDGVPFLIEVNPLPSLHPKATLATGARAKGIDYLEMIELIVMSAARRYGIPMRSARPTKSVAPSEGRMTAREAGCAPGRFPAGQYNAITDVAGIEVGHVTHIADDVDAGDGEGKRTVRTGVTAVVPRADDLFLNHLPAGGFILNGIGEMSGMVQAMEWGWLETPVLLTNTMSVGKIHTGVIQHLLSRHPELGKIIDVAIPIVGETNDAFLNDVRAPATTPEDAIRAIEAAESGPVEQGSVGGGTGMITFDFAGGIGTSSRVVSVGPDRYTTGVLVQSNFGYMRNLTMDGMVVGRDLDDLYPTEGRRKTLYGSVIVVVATDAPLLPAQLDRLAKRAALGLGRVGSHAASTSGEIVFAFSTGNRMSRKLKGQTRLLNMSFLSDARIDVLYEAVIEATEEAVLNAVFCSKGMSGREGRYAPPLPITEVQRRLGDATGDLERTGEQVRRGA